MLETKHAEKNFGWQAKLFNLPSTLNMFSSCFLRLQVAVYTIHAHA